MRNDGPSRRQFLQGRLQRPKSRLLPPGLDIDKLDDCTACGKCVTHCPSGIIGLSNAMPEIDFRLGECTFCGECAAACPQDLFQTQQATRFDHIIAFGQNCLSFNRVDCQSCRDVCPNNAISFRPILGGPFVPHLSAEACTGCGACLAVCPVDGIQLAAAAAQVSRETQYG